MSLDEADAARRYIFWYVFTMNQDDVLTGLGDKFAVGLSRAVAGARSDIDEMRRVFPSWFPPMTKRGLANIIWERLWARLCDELSDHSDVKVVQYGATNEIYVGLGWVLRVKRHSVENAISTYATQTAIEFYEQQGTLDGMTLTSLAVGYQWDPELNEIGAPVLSYRDGKDNPIWMVRLDEPGDGTAVVKWTPVDPKLPNIVVGIDEVGNDIVVGSK